MALLGGEMADADLRPMSLGEVLDRTFKIYRNHFWLFAGIAALPSGILLILRVANSARTAWRGGRVIISAQSPGVSPSAILTGVVVAVVFMLAFFALLGYAQAASVFAVSDLYLGGAAGLRQSYSRVGTKGLRIMVIFMLVAMIVFVGLLLFIIPGIFLGCRFALAVPISMLENTGAVRSLERSMQLTKGHTGEIFVVLLMVIILTYVVILVFQVPFMFVAIAAAKAHQALSFLTLLLVNLASFLSEVLVWPVGTIALSLMYYNLRVRKEAFDIQHLMTTLGTSSTLGAPSAL
jgi:Membrane domain of glycerophosphoryl diester phosphodiesterase